MLKNKKVIIFDMDGTLIDSIGIWNKTDEILIGKLTNNAETQIPNIQQIRDGILAECKSNDIYLEYCDFLRKKYNSDMSSKVDVNENIILQNYMLERLLERISVSNYKYKYIIWKL